MWSEMTVLTAGSWECESRHGTGSGSGQALGRTGAIIEALGVNIFSRKRIYREPRMPSLGGRRGRGTEAPQGQENEAGVARRVQSLGSGKRSWAIRGVPVEERRKGAGEAFSRNCCRWKGKLQWGLEALGGEDRADTRQEGTGFTECPGSSEAGRSRCLPYR